MSKTYPSLHVALFGNVHQSAKSRYVAIVLQKLHELGVAVGVEEHFARFIHRELDVDLADCRTFSADERGCAADVAVSVGGDGTFLGTAAKVGTSGVPILGINTGRLGFLADVSPDGIEPALEALCRGDYVVERRTALAVMTNGKLESAYPYALNEVAVLKHDNSSLIEISTYVDGQFLTTFLADGLIVSTPTGSTGYSLSVGGPILVPGSGTLCLSAVAPHSLSVRPVVVRDDVEVRLQVTSRTHNFLLSADGHSASLPDSIPITLRRAPHTVKVIKMEHKHFFDTLRDKMLWGADQRQ